MQKVSIPQSLAQAIHDYMMTRPMGEVEKMALGLRQATPLDEPDAPQNGEAEILAE